MRGTIPSLPSMPTMPRMGVAGGGGVAALAATMVLQWDTGADNALVTTTNLGTNTHTASPGVGWSYSESRTPTHTRIDAEELALPFTVSCNGINYDGVGAKSIRFDYTERNAGTLNWDGLRYTHPAGISDCLVAVPVKINTATPGVDASTDLVQVLSNAQCIAQVRNWAEGKTYGIEGQLSGGGSTFGPLTSYANTTEYLLLVYHSQTDQTATLVSLSLSDRTFISAIETLMESISDVVATVFSDYLLTQGNGSIKLGTASWFTEGQEDAVIALINVPAVTSLTCTQTDVDELTVTCASTAIRFKIERSSNGGGAWSTLETSYDPGRTNTSEDVEYVDSTVSEGATYLYRFTAIVLGRNSSTANSNSVEVDNGPFAPPTWSDGVAGASTDSDEANNDFGIRQPVTNTTTGSCVKLRAWVGQFNSAANIKCALYDASLNLIAEGEVTGATVASDSYIEITLDSAVAVTASTVYHVSFISSNSSNVQWGFLAAQPANSSFQDFATAFASYPPDPFPAGGGLTRLYAFGMGVI